MPSGLIIKNIKISEVSSDAVDVDFSKGQLEDTEFINILGIFHLKASSSKLAFRVPSYSFI